MNLCCAFCGMPPLDGEPCCTGKFRDTVMRSTDANLKRARAEHAALVARCAELEKALIAVRLNVRTNVRKGANRDYIVEMIDAALSEKTP